MATNADKMLIHIGAFSFDPLTEPPAPSAQARDPDDAPSGPLPHIVQFVRPLDREERQTLLGTYRLRLDDYLPDNAFAETLDPKILSRLSKHPLVRASVPFQAAELRRLRQTGNGAMIYIGEFVYPGIEYEGSEMGQ